VTDRAELNLNGTNIELPVVEGTEGEKAVDIAQLRSKTGYVTLRSRVHEHRIDDQRHHVPRWGERDPALPGFPIEQLGEHSTFVETAYLLIYGHYRCAPSSPASPTCSRATRCCTRT